MLIAWQYLCQWESKQCSFQPELQSSHQFTSDEWDQSTQHLVSYRKTLNVKKKYVYMYVWIHTINDTCILAADGQKYPGTWMYYYLMLLVCTGPLNYSELLWAHFWALYQIVIIHIIQITLMFIYCLMWQWLFIASNEMTKTFGDISILNIKYEFPL